MKPTNQHWRYIPKFRMSQGDDPVSEDALKRLAGEFDLEAILVLDLSDKGLTSCGCVPQCIPLRVLNLSLNELSSLSPLSTLTSLQHLDLSANQITSIDGVDKLESLQELNLAGNNITELDSLLPLSSLPHLTHLTLSLPESSLTNPVCSHPNYVSFITDSLPCLQWLDGEQVGGPGAEFYTKCHQLEKEYGQGHDSNIVSDDATQHKSDYETLEDPLKEFPSLIATNEDLSDDTISKLLSECTETSGRIQKHIQELRTFVAGDKR